MKVTAQEAGAILRRRARAFEREIRDAERRHLQAAEAEAKRLSAGAITTAQLRQLGHPYRIGGAPPQDPAIINAQAAEGGLRDSWKTDGPRKTATGFTSTLKNLVPYARFLFTGTRLMIRRPLLETMRRRMKNVRKNLARKALRDANRAS